MRIAPGPTSGLVPGLVAASHPVPTAVVTALAVVLVAGAGATAGTVALASAAVLAGQLSVGLSNDWLDARRDTAAGRTGVDRPGRDRVLGLGDLDLERRPAAGERRGDRGHLDVRAVAGRHR